MKSKCLLWVIRLALLLAVADSVACVRLPPPPPLPRLPPPPLP